MYEYVVYWCTLDKRQAVRFIWTSMFKLASYPWVQVSRQVPTIARQVLRFVLDMFHGIWPIHNWFALGPIREWTALTCYIVTSPQAHIFRFEAFCAFFGCENPLVHQRLNQLSEVDEVADGQILVCRFGWLKMPVTAVLLPNLLVALSSLRIIVKRGLISDIRYPSFLDKHITYVCVCICWKHEPQQL